MILRLFRKQPPTLDVLYQRVVAASRAPALYGALGVPDTVEGRFESLALHVVLVLRRLRGLPPPAAEVAQDLADALFRHLDASLREMGVGDMKVPKRMKGLAAAFYGRAARYDAVLDAADAAALADTLRRNVGGENAAALARYVLAAEASLGGDTLADLLARGPSFPPPDRFEETAP
jgi:cytochrome b pre-mRNA-processing protein 3